MKHEVHEMCRILRQALRKRPWCRLLPSLYMWLLLGAWIEKGSRFSRTVVLPSLCAEYLSIQGTNSQDIFIYRLLVSYPDHLFAKMGYKAIQTRISRSTRFVIVTIFHLIFSTTISEDHVAKGNITSLGKAGGISDQRFPCNPGLLGCGCFCKGPSAHEHPVPRCLFAVGSPLGMSDPEGISPII